MHTIINTFFDKYGDLAALIGSVIICILAAMVWRKRRHALCRRRMVALFYWGPSLLLSCMFMHTANNAWGTYLSFAGGHGVFTFHNYSVYLFGFVLGYQSWLLLMRCREHVEGTARRNKRLYPIMIVILLTTLPTSLFTPIGYVPAIAMAITLGISFFVHRPDQRQKRSSIVVHPRKAALMEA